MTHPYILLDAAQGLIIIPVFFILHLGTTLLIEGGLLYSFQYSTFKKCLLHAFIANISSLILGLFLMSPVQQLVIGICGYQDRETNLLVLLALLYLLTVLIEGIALRLLNKPFPVRKLIIATLLMNLITYGTLFIILQFIQ
jgi:hypothetical protein